MLLVKYFHNGIDVMEYTGGRDTASLIDFIRRYAQLTNLVNLKIDELDFKSSAKCIYTSFTIFPNMSYRSKISVKYNAAYLFYF